MVVLVERVDRIGGRLVGDPLKAIDQLAQIAAGVKAIVGQALGQRHVANAKVGLVRIGSDARTAAYFAPRKFGPPERDMLGIEK